MATVVSDRATLVSAIVGFDTGAVAAGEGVSEFNATVVVASGVGFARNARNPPAAATATEPAATMARTRAFPDISRYSSARDVP
jgi:hypothetical protein